MKNKFLLLFLLVAFLFGSCNKNENTDSSQSSTDSNIDTNSETSHGSDDIINLTNIEINTPSSNELIINKTLQLTINYTPNNATNKDIIWSTSNDKASVSDSGLVTGLILGEVNIIATHGQLSDSITLTIIPVPLFSIVTPESTDLIVGDTLQLTLSFDPVDLSPDITWTSTNRRATVDSDGLVTAVETGEVHINAKNNKNDLTSSLTLSIKPVPVPVTDVAITNKSSQPTTLNIGQKLNLYVTISPDSATNKSVTWVSDNPDAVTVSNYGNVEAVAVGIATITATSKDNTSFSDSITFAVTGLVHYATFNFANNTDFPGNTGYAQARINSVDDIINPSIKHHLKLYSGQITTSGAGTGYYAPESGRLLTFNATGLAPGNTRANFTVFSYGDSTGALLPANVRKITFRSSSYSSSESTTYKLMICQENCDTTGTWVQDGSNATVNNTTAKDITFNLIGDYSSVYVKVIATFGKASGDCRFHISDIKFHKEFIPE